MNAEFIEIDAYNADIAGFTQSAAYQVTADQTIAQQRSIQAAQNIDVGFGTAKQIQEESKLTSKLNQIDIINKAHEVSMGLKSQARNLRFSGVQAVSQGEAKANATRTSGYVNAFGSALNAYTSAPEKDKKKFKSYLGYGE